MNALISYKWFYINYYRYLFARPFNLRKLICRYKGHPNGEIYYKSDGLEPDHRCKDCHDDLG